MRAQLLCDHPGGLSKKRRQNQLIDLPYYGIWNHASMMVSVSLPSHAKLDAKTSCTHTHEKPVWDHALRVSDDCCDTDAGISKLWRLVQLRRTPWPRCVRTPNPLQAPASTSPGQHLCLTALRRDKYSELVAVVEENNPGRGTYAAWPGIQYCIQYSTLAKRSIPRSFRN